MAREGYDAEFLVIGSGPAGVSAALPLVEAGRNVLMIDGAGGTAMPTRPDTSAPWRHILDGDFEAALSEETRSPKLDTPYARRITDSFLSDNTITSENFLPIGAVARGGLSSIWGGFVSEYDETDFMDWPVSAADMRPYYNEIIERIGVSGSSEDHQSGFYGGSGELDPPLTLGPTAEYLYRRYRAQKYGPAFSLGLARNAVITRDRAGRRACDLRRDCLWGCERGAIYHSRFDLAALTRHGNFRLMDDALAVRLQSVDGILEVVMRDERRFRARKILLAAGCLATTQLAIGAMLQPPAHVRLQNNPLMAAPLIVPARLGSMPPSRGHALAQLGYRYTYAPENSDYVTGALYEIDSLPAWHFTARLPISRRAGMTLFPLVSAAILVMTSYFPGNLSDNILTWSKSDGRVFTSIRGGSSPLLPGIAKSVRLALRAQLRGLGALMLPGAMLAVPGADIHYGCTLPMGGAGPGGTTSRGELNSALGIFVVDSSGFPTMPAKYPTLTIMANAARIGDDLAHSG